MATPFSALQQATVEVWGPDDWYDVTPETIREWQRPGDPAEWLDEGADVLASTFHEYAAAPPNPYNYFETAKQDHARWQQVASRASQLAGVPIFFESVNPAVTAWFVDASGHVAPLGGAHAEAMQGVVNVIHLLAVGRAYGYPDAKREWQEAAHTELGWTKKDFNAVWPTLVELAQNNPAPDQVYDEDPVIRSYWVDEYTAELAAAYFATVVSKMAILDDDNVDALWAEAEKLLGFTGAF